MNRFEIRLQLPESESNREVPKDSHPYYNKIIYIHIFLNCQFMLIYITLTLIYT